MAKWILPFAADEKCAPTDMIKNQKANLES
jgi:hypothetical protein